MVAGETRPLVVCTADGAAVDVAWQDEKAFRKSLENGTLWSVHPDTGRVLPWNDGPRATVEDRGTWYRAVLTARETPNADNSAADISRNAATALSGDPSKYVRSSLFIADSRASSRGTVGTYT